MNQGANWRWLGVLAVFFYGVHGAHQLAGGHPENLLWTCHLAALAVGIGLLFRSATIHAIGFFWLTVGVPLWIFDLVTGGELLLTSPLTHIGGLVLGVVGLRKLGLPRHAWWQALVVLAALHLICRWVTPERANVNLAHAIWPGSEPYFPSHFVYVLSVLALCAAVFLLVMWALRKAGLPESPGGRDALLSDRSGYGTGGGGADSRGQERLPQRRDSA